VATETFWEYVTFALNSVVFLLIGLEVPVQNLFASWLPIIAAYLIVTLARWLVVHVVWRLVGLTRERFSWSWSAVLSWGGIRGALPMVLALGLPPDFAFREQIISTTFGVVTLSILGHGLTMLPLLRRLRVVRSEDDQGTHDLLRGELQTIAAALEEIDRLERLHFIAPDSVGQLRTEYQQRAAHAREEVGKLAVERSHLHEQDVYQARHHLLLVEKSRVADAYQSGLLSPSVHDRLLADIDARLLELESKSNGEAPSKDTRVAQPKDDDPVDRP